MPYKGPIGFARITSLMMNIFIGLVLGALFLVLTHDLAAMSTDEIIRSFCQSLIMSVLVGYAAGDFLPTMSVANKIANALHAKSSLLRHFITSLTLAIINITVILTLCMLIALLAVMPLIGVVQVIISLWPPAVGIGFVAIFATLPVAQMVATRASGFNPKEAQQDAPLEKITVLHKE